MLLKYMMHCLKIMQCNMSVITICGMKASDMR